MCLPCAHVAKPLFLYTRQRSGAAQPETLRLQKSLILTFKAVRLLWEKEKKKRDSKNKKGSEWPVKEAAGHQIFTSRPLFCDKNRSSDGLETLFGIQDKRGHQGTTLRAGGEEEPCSEDSLFPSPVAPLKSSSSFHRPAEQCWTQISGPLYVPLKRGPGPFHTVI